MKVDLESVLRSEANHILNQLLLNLSLYKKQVMAGVCFIARVGEREALDSDSEENLVSDMSVCAQYSCSLSYIYVCVWQARYLQNEHRLLGILAFFHARLARGDVEAGKLVSVLKLKVDVDIHVHVLA